MWSILGLHIQYIDNSNPEVMKIFQEGLFSSWIQKKSNDLRGPKEWNRGLKIYMIQMKLQLKLFRLRESIGKDIS